MEIDCRACEGSGKGPHDHKGRCLACGGSGKLAVPIPVIAEEKKLLKLDLACGQSPREGFTGVDINAPGAEKVNLMTFPWKWETNSVEELHCSHFIEHLPCRQVGVGDFGIADSKLFNKYMGQDYLFAFFDECARILIPQGKMTVIVPCARSNRAFQDPTHRRFIVAETFLYLSAEWRKLQKLDHYNVNCNFGINVVPGTSPEFNLLHAEVQARKYNESWNVVLDWQAMLVNLKTE